MSSVGLEVLLSVGMLWDSCDGTVTCTGAAVTGSVLQHNCFQHVQTNLCALVFYSIVTAGIDSVGTRMLIELSTEISAIIADLYISL